MSAFGKLQVVSLVPGTVVIRRAALFQTLDGKLTDRLEHPEPRLGRLAQCTHKALVHQFGDDIQGVEAAIGICHLIDRLKIGTADKDRQACEQQLGVG